MKEFNKQKQFIIIAAGVGIIAAFLPWAKITFFVSETSIGLSVGAWFSLLLYAGAGALAFLGEKSSAIEESKRMLFVILSGLGALFSLWRLIQFGSEKMISAGIGCYLSLLAGLALVGIYFFVTDEGEIKFPK